VGRVDADSIKLVLNIYHAHYIIIILSSLAFRKKGKVQAHPYKGRVHGMEMNYIKIIWGCSRRRFSGRHLS
jgi:hypothetical protein